MPPEQEVRGSNPLGRTISRGETALRFQDLKPEPSRVLAGVMAALHFVLVGMLVYFRLGPMTQVFDRFAERGTPLPSWLTLALTVGTLVMAAFLGLRGLRFLRQALPGKSSSPSS